MLWDGSTETARVWQDLLAKHAKTPFHLLLLGGDQIYSDSMWEELGALAKWAERRMTPLKESERAAR